MRHVDDELVNKQDPVIAYLDAKRRNEAGRKNYSEEKIAAGEKLLELVQEVYFRRRTYINYRDKFIAVKVGAPKVADTFTTEYTKLMKHIEENGFIIKKLAKSLVIHILQDAK